MLTGIVGALGSIANFIGGLFSGGLSGFIATITENLITLGLLAFAVGLGLFAIWYLKRRRRTLDQERLAALIKGLHRAGVAQDILSVRKPDSRDHLVSGLRWLFGGVGAASAMYGWEALQPAATPEDALRGALIGLIPGALGMAHLVCSWLQKYAPSPSAARPAGAVYRVGYRPAARRF